MTDKIACFTNIAPHYRESLWLKMLEDSELEYHFFYGISTNNGIKLINTTGQKWEIHTKRLHALKNVRIFNRLIFQFGVLKQIFFGEWATCIFLGDANIISNWIGAFIARLRKIPVIFWGHGFYGDEYGLKKWMRIRFLKMADVNLVYGHWAKDRMKENGFEDKDIKVIYNSLDYGQSLHFRDNAIDGHYFINTGIFKDENPILLFIGRLTEEKNIGVLVDAVQKLEHKNKPVNLLIIGNGPEYDNLKNKANSLSNICFYGACYNEKELSVLISNSDLCVSPGNVGLTAIHSLSYGTPVCTHNNFKKQMPEFEAIKEGYSGCFFDWRKINIAETIDFWLDNAQDREELRKNCYTIVDRSYNPENQVYIFSEVITKIIT